MVSEELVEFDIFFAVSVFVESQLCLSLLIATRNIYKKKIEHNIRNRNIAIKYPSVVGSI